MNFGSAIEAPTHLGSIVTVVQYFNMIFNWFYSAAIACFCSNIVSTNFDVVFLDSSFFNLPDDGRKTGAGFYCTCLI